MTNEWAQVEAWWNRAWSDHFRYPVATTQPDSETGADGRRRVSRVIYNAVTDRTYTAREIIMQAEPGRVWVEYGIDIEGHKDDAGAGVWHPAQHTEFGYIMHPTSCDYIALGNLFADRAYIFEPNTLHRAWMRNRQAWLTDFKNLKYRETNGGMHGDLTRHVLDISAETLLKAYARELVLTFDGAL